MVKRAVIGCVSESNSIFKINFQVIRVLIVWYHQINGDIGPGPICPLRCAASSQRHFPYTYYTVASSRRNAAQWSSRAGALEKNVHFWLVKWWCTKFWTVLKIWRLMTYDRCMFYISFLNRIVYRRTSNWNMETIWL